ncbi:MAG: 50S ribosomal protein L17 [Candidatus Omnitrophica bacterium]|nr:50S ribosomal protein L17 [Candidatus Omnitrophota bacterium]
MAGNKLGRNSSWRKATVRDIAKATLLREKIFTTKAKAKESRKLVDKLITLGKKGTLAHRRRAFAVLCDHKLVSELFNKIAPRFQMRQGGYTRIIPLALNRRGDNAQMVVLELTEKKPVPVPKAKKAEVAKKKAAAAGHEVIPAETKPETKQADVSKPSSPKTPKASLPKEKKDKSKTEKRAMGGIKKIFRRKSTSE